MNDVKRQARHAGFLYMALALIAPIGLMYVPGELIATGNATATADNIRAYESLFRLDMASELVHQVIGIFQVLALPMLVVLAAMIFWLWHVRTNGNWPARAG